MGRRLIHNQNIFWWKYILPGQGFGLQLLNCRASPVHVAPPWTGVGLLHVRVRKLSPPPHETLHERYSPQEPQPPSTVKEMIIIKIQILTISLYQFQTTKNKKKESDVTRKHSETLWNLGIDTLGNIIRQKIGYNYWTIFWVSFSRPLISCHEICQKHQIS